jgi:DNA-binding HxlR family transcriptional regulator
MLGSFCDETSWKERALALRDSVELFRGKWKFCILKNLAPGSMRFTDLQKKIKISPKVLTRELHDLELNMLITRTVKQTKPVTVEYSITEYARETWQVMQALIVFGEKHRNKIKERLKLNKRQSK